MITIQNTNLISKTAKRGHVFMVADFLTEHCGTMASIAFHPYWTSSLLSWDQLQLHVAKSELAIIVMSQFLFLFFLSPQLIALTTLQPPKLENSENFFLISSSSLPYIICQILLTLPLKYFSNLHLLFILMSIGPVQGPIFLRQNMKSLCHCLLPQPINTSTTMT